MSKFKFTATHGVHLTDQVKDAKTGDTEHETWAHFTRDEAADERPSITGQRGGIGSRVYRFETDDAKIADRVRGLMDKDGGEYGVQEVKGDDAKPDENKSNA